MEQVFVLWTEAVLLTMAVSLDAFAASFCYGSRGIKMPWKSVLVMDVGCAVLLGAALLFGNFLATVMPLAITEWVGFLVLFLLGVGKLLDSGVKSLIRRGRSVKKHLQFSLFQVRFVLQLYADPIDADIDHSNTISPTEALWLTLALSLDGLAVGLGAGVSQMNVWIVICAALLTEGAAILGGCWFGRKVARLLPFDLSWLSGLLLILMAFVR